MAFFPSPTTGLGVAAKIVVEGNEGSKTTPGYNNVVLSVSGTNGQTTFQLNPQLQDAAGNEITPGTAFTLTSVASSSPGTLTLTAVAASVNGDAVYTGTITGGGSNALVGLLFTVAGFAGANNNGVYEAVASTTTTLTLVNAGATAETHAATATSEEGTAVYTGTITGGGSNAFKGQTFVVVGFVTNPSNNGTFIATASSTTTLTLENNAAVAETHAATATSQEAGSNELTYVAYPAKTLTGNTYQPSGTATAVATVSSSGVITAVAPGGVEVEVSYPTFNNSVGDVVSSGNIMNGLPINKIYATVNVQVLP
jgi:hypothetical protein